MDFIKFRKKLQDHVTYLSTTYDTLFVTDNSCIYGTR